MAAAESIYSCPQCMTLVDPSSSSLPPLNPTLVSRDILDTNDPPLESQIPFLRDFVSQGRARMSALNAKIALLQSAMDKLREERDAIAVNIRKHEGGLSLLRRLPTELLSHIFRFTLPPYYFDEPAPWTISTVCARWRAIVVFQPAFWTTIAYTQHDKKFAGSFALETQLLRSKDLPLNVVFHTDDDFQPTSEQLQLLQIICEHVARWEIASLRGRKELFDPLQSFMKSKPSLLRELTVEIDTCDEDVALHVFQDAPQLQRVAVNRGLWAFPLTLGLPSSQLLQFGGSNTWDGHLYALRGANNLVECALEIHGSETSEMFPTTIPLPSLLRLSLSDSGFLEFLETPALEELYCGFASPVLPFLRRQACKLQTLVLWQSGAPPNGSDLTNVVDAVPTITTLALAFPLPTLFANDLLSRPEMAPVLQHISTGLERDPPNFPDDFLPAIESRWQRGSLKSVKAYSTDFSPTLLERLELLQVKGMEVAVSLQVPDAVTWDMFPAALCIDSIFLNDAEES